LIRFAVFKGPSKSNGSQTVGRVLLAFDPQSHCFQGHGVEKVNGTFVDGLLSGMATIHFANKTILRCIENETNGTEENKFDIKYTFIKFTLIYVIFKCEDCATSNVHTLLI
jgi:hypothetical protein